MSEEIDMRQRMKGPIKMFVDWAREHAENIVDIYGMDLDECCESPIEQCFYLAWMLHLEQERVMGEVHSHADYYFVDRHWRGDFNTTPPPDHYLLRFDLVWPQFQIGAYRADFAIRRFKFDHTTKRLEGGSIIVIECDGHDFHEKTKEQAARDKERDRVLQTQGYIVLRFTGSELWNDVSKCIEEVEDCIEQDITRSVQARRKVLA